MVFAVTVKNRQIPRKKVCNVTLFSMLLLQSKKAMDVGRPGRISVEDIIFLIRKDPKKYSRVKELLLMNEELRKARKAFDEVKYVSK
jgi:hypothetical protein